MDPKILYTACLLGALGLYLLVRPAGRRAGPARSVKALGAVLALGVVGWLVMSCAEALGLSAGAGRPEIFFAVFGLIALVCAVKMITNSRPVYSALYFVLVVLASAGLFLLLEAEFMAFALIIVYAGAILITYMFVLMLAQQAPTADDPTGQPEYDLNPRDPAMGAIVGFLLLALLSRMVLDGAAALPDPPGTRAMRDAAWTSLLAMPRRIEDAVDAKVDGPFTLARNADGTIRYEVPGDGENAIAWYVPEGGEPTPLTLADASMPENVQSVGLALIAKFPVSLELAGVILLMAMLGAVILARRQIELTEDEKREAAGMRRLGLHDEPDGGASAATSAPGPAGGPAGGPAS